jgi:hypothetical protein
VVNLVSFSTFSFSHLGYVVMANGQRTPWIGKVLAHPTRQLGWTHHTTGIEIKEFVSVSQAISRGHHVCIYLCQQNLPSSKMPKSAVFVPTKSTEFKNAKICCGLNSFSLRLEQPQTWAASDLSSLRLEQPQTWAAADLSSLRLEQTTSTTPIFSKTKFVGGKVFEEQFFTWTKWTMFLQIYSKMCCQA